MKKTLTCPKCEGRQILHVAHMEAANGEVMPVAVRRTFLGPRGIGSFDTFICRGCAYTEWYAADPAGITPDESIGIRLIDNTPKATLR